MITTIKKTQLPIATLDISHVMETTKLYIKKSFTKKYIVRFAHNNQRVFRFGQYVLLSICFIFIYAAFQELATLKDISKSVFLNSYCSLNFPHNYNGCIAFVRQLAFRNIYDAGRFFLVPIAILIGYGIYKVYLQERIKRYLS